MILPMVLSGGHNVYPDIVATLGYTEGVWVEWQKLAVVIPTQIMGSMVHIVVAYLLRTVE